MVKYLRLASTISYFALLVLLFVWTIWLSPSPSFPKSLVLLVMVLPWMLPMRGILQGKPYTFAWAAFLALIYFTLGVGNLVVSDHPKYLSILEIALSLIFFFSAAFYARLSGNTTPKN